MILSKEKIRAEIIRNLEETLINGLDYDIELSDNFVDMGASSIDRTVVIYDTLEALSLDIPLLDLTLASSIGELVGLIYEKNI